MFQPTSQRQINKRVVFCAAHHIPGAGKCEQNHGHNWTANISVTQIQGDLDNRGFIADVRDLKDAAFKYDHDDLNKYFEYPSTENVAQQIADDALEMCMHNNSAGVFIVNVSLAETEANSASASASNFTASLPDMAAFDEPEAHVLAREMKEAHDKEAAYQFGGGNLPPRKVRFIKRNDA